MALMEVPSHLASTSKFSARRTQWQQDLKDFVDYKGFKANREFPVLLDFKGFRDYKVHRETVENRAHKVIQDLQVHRVHKVFEAQHPQFQDLRDLLEQVHPSLSMVEVQSLHSSMGPHLTVEVLYKFLIN
jgi:hypothetical protein